MSYKEQLNQNAEICFQCFMQHQLLNSKKRIFDNASEIQFYYEVYEFLTSDHYLDEDTCKYLCQYHENIIDVLYAEYQDDDQYSIYAWNGIYEMIADIRLIDNENNTAKAKNTKKERTLYDKRI